MTGTEQQCTTSAERFYHVVMAVSATVLIMVAVGGSFADSFTELLVWTGLAVWVVLVIIALAFVAGLNRRH